MNNDFYEKMETFVDSFECALWSDGLFDNFREKYGEYGAKIAQDVLYTTLLAMQISIDSMKKEEEDF